MLLTLWSNLFGPKGKHCDEHHEVIQANIAEGKAIMLDVRSQEEWNGGTLKQAILLSITEIKALPKGTQEIPGLQKETIVYCH